MFAQGSFGISERHGLANCLDGTLVSTSELVFTRAQRFTEIEKRWQENESTTRENQVKEQNERIK